MIDSKRNLIWIFGGYATYYPYKRTDGMGSGPGLQSVAGGGGFIPYPDTYEFYKDDLWYYNMSNELWTEVEKTPGSEWPLPRSDFIFELIKGNVHNKNSCIVSITS